RVADLRLDPAARRSRQSLGPLARDGDRDPAAGEAPGHPGIPVPALRRDGDPDPALPARGARPAPVAPPGAEDVTAPLLRCRGLSRRFGGVVALDGLDVEVAAGSV